jgi:uncharacterized membrane protein
MSEEKKENIEDVEYNVVDEETEPKGIMNYLGAIIGAVVAMIICATQFYKLVLFVAMVIAGAFTGNYIQKNKSEVKVKLKEFIDKF